MDILVSKFILHYLYVHIVLNHPGCKRMSQNVCRNLRKKERFSFFFGGLIYLLQVIISDNTTQSLVQCSLVQIISEPIHEYEVGISVNHCSAFDLGFFKARSLAISGLMLR